MTLERPNLSVLAKDESLQPDLVRQCGVAQKYLKLLGDLAWDNFPERATNRAWPGPKPHPRAPFVAAYLVKINEGQEYMSNLRTYLVEHPALVWVLGFELEPDASSLWGFDVEASVPSRKQLGQVLRDLPNEHCQFLLKSSVALIGQALPPDLAAELGQTISLDTKHQYAWVSENNPKAYIKESDRLDKTRQPQADASCKLGCKKKSNRPPAKVQGSEAQPKAKEKVSNFSALDVYLWGYASGIVTTKIPDWAEVVLADLTLPFNAGETIFFLPLMAQTEQNLGHKPTHGALDAAFDAFYVHDYFVNNGGFAAVPFVVRGGRKQEDLSFDPDTGLPKCQAGFTLALKGTYTSTRGLVSEQRGRFRCPLTHPQPTGQVCPVNHPQWPEGGCRVECGLSAGVRMRYELDHDSPAYKQVYDQRSASERINAQATALGLERPKLRHIKPIANQNTLTYVLINLRALHRIRSKKQTLAQTQL
jgi:hypothetical protein